MNSKSTQNEQTLSNMTRRNNTFLYCTNKEDHGSGLGIVSLKEGYSKKGIILKAYWRKKCLAKRNCPLSHSFSFKVQSKVFALRGVYTLGNCSEILSKLDNFYDFLFVSLYIEPLIKWVHSNSKKDLALEEQKFSVFSLTDKDGKHF